MAIEKELLHEMIEKLSDADKKTAFDFLQYLLERAKKKTTSWDEIDKEEPDDEPLTEEEIRQLNSDEGYIAGEDAKREFGLQVDLP
ncbi:hypothetical protein [Aneurinibacillus sp. UBA3580]|jgi:uncharacterized protein YfeS|uniref:hypothetical protein n=1 Tax=Aneurinibacillus sp. UBA3580 TaxID=1946041 RepID=UPI00257D7F43|nr:hypothetical protein [Aneurinibacillus sp. UBA3580]